VPEEFADLLLLLDKDLALTVLANDLDLAL
jgi:hypothetical protein